MWQILSLIHIKAGNNVIVVLSAQGDTTDDLIEKPTRSTPNASRRELDMLLSTGEQISIALCAMALEKRGLPSDFPGGLAGGNPNQQHL